MAPTAEHILQGFQIGITADRRWEEQAELLCRRGATVMHGPTMRTLPLDAGPDLRHTTEALIADPPLFLLANTGIGIRSWFAAAESWGLSEALHAALSQSRIFARGPKASTAAHRLGLCVEAQAASERLDDLVAMLPLTELNGQRVAFQRHGDSSPEALEPLVLAGADIVEVPIYRWILPDDLNPVLRLGEATIAQRIHAVTFTSAPAVRNFFLILDDAGLGDAVRERFAAGVIAACVGPVCGAAATAEGIEQPLVPDRFRLGPLLRILTEALVGRQRHGRLNGEPTVLRGSSVTIGDAHIVLTESEAALLDALMRQRGAVCSEESLLRTVWGEQGHDPLVVEVTVAGLRTKLGAAAAGIVAVQGGGYQAV